MARWLEQFGFSLPSMGALDRLDGGTDGSEVSGVEDAEELERQLCRVVGQLMFSYELVRTFMGSRTGQGVLQVANLVRWENTTSQLRHVMGLLQASGCERSAIVAGWAASIARGLFAVSRTTKTPPDRTLLPDPEWLAGWLTEIEGFGWLRDHGQAIPTTFADRER